MCEVEVSLQFACDLFVSGEFLAVVRSDRVHLFTMRLQQSDHCLADGECGLALNLVDQREAGLPFHDAHDGLAVVLTNHGIRFPVTDPAARLNDSWSVFDGQPVGYGAAPFRLAITLLPQLLAAQILPQQSACSLVRVDPLIHRLWADGDVPADLLWAPLFQQPVLRELPCRIVYRSCVERLPFHRLAVCLFGTVAASATVARQLSADCGFASFQHFSYFVLLVSCLLQGVNLVSFFSGDVCVVHLCNFDWLVKKAWMLLHLTHLTCVTQNCTSS